MSCVWCVLATVGALSPALQEELRSADAHYSRAEFGRAIALLDATLSRTEEPEARAQIYLRLGANWTAIGNAERANEAFQHVLSIDPDFVLPALASRRLRAAFEATREAFVIRPTLTHVVPAPVDPQKGVTLTISSSTPLPRRYEMRLFYRLFSTSPYRKLTLVDQVTLGPLELEVPGATVLEYYFQLATPKEEIAAGLGDAPKPYRISLLWTEAAVPLWRKWWFWTVVGGVVLASASGIVAAVLLSQPSRPAVADAQIVLDF